MLIFKKKKLFKKILSGVPSIALNSWIQVSQHNLLGLFWSRLKPFGTLIVLLKDFFEKVDVEKKSADDN